MEKTFKSKVDFRWLLPLLVLLVGAEAYMIYHVFILGIVGVGMVMAFVFYLWADTMYVLTGDNKLKIKSGFFFHREIYIKAIKKVRLVRDHRASPALSSDRLEISYNRYGKVVVSPHKKTEFIRELRVVNPRIRVE